MILMTFRLKVLWVCVCAWLSGFPSGFPSGCVSSGLSSRCNCGHRAEIPKADVHFPLSTFSSINSRCCCDSRPHGWRKFTSFLFQPRQRRLYYNLSCYRRLSILNLLLLLVVFSHDSVETMALGWSGRDEENVNNRVLQRFKITFVHF